MSEPRTEAGRKLLNEFGPENHDVRADILAIESQAASLDLDALELTLERLELDCDPQANLIHSTCDHDDQALGFAREYERHRGAAR